MHERGGSGECTPPGHPSGPGNAPDSVQTHNCSTHHVFQYVLAFAAHSRSMFCTIAANSAQARRLVIILGVIGATNRAVK